MSKVIGATLPLPSFILNSRTLYIVSRWIDKSIFGKYFLLSISRYSSTISIFSTAHDRNLYRGENLQTSYLNIGSGFFFHPYWQCIDLPACSSIYKSVQGRAGRDFIPANLNTDTIDFFSPNSFKAIYSSHTLEHLDRQRIPSLFLQLSSLLAPEGTFRICVPDLLSFYNINKARHKMDPSDMLFFMREAFTPLYAFLVSLSESEMFQHLEYLHLCFNKFKFLEYLDFLPEYLSLNSTATENFSPDFHLSYPTEDFLREVALASGFSEAYRTVRGLSRDSCFANKFLFDTTIPEYSLYMEFVK